MSVKIRLTRTGRKKIVRYRVVVADGRMKRDGRFLENIGTYDPQANPKKFQFKLDRVAYWLKQGAEPSETVMNLLKQDRHRLAWLILRWKPLYPNYKKPAWK